MNWIQRKIYLYNVTFGLYMLDWWERCLFNILVVVLLWFVCTRCFDLLQSSLKGRVLSTPNKIWLVFQRSANYCFVEINDWKH
nr:hypothetical protein DM860_009354 [Ipomoea batatas]